MSLLNMHSLRNKVCLVYWKVCFLFLFFMDLLWIQVEDCGLKEQSARFSIEAIQNHAFALLLGISSVASFVQFKFARD